MMYQRRGVQREGAAFAKALRSEEVESARGTAEAGVAGAQKVRGTVA